MDNNSGLHDFLNTIINTDTVLGMRKIPDETVDLIFADPPYNLQLKEDLWRPNQTRVSAVTDHWDKFSSFQDYDDFSMKWLTECRRVMKKNAVIWVIGTYHNIFRIGKIMQDLGFWIINDVIWIKANPMPNFRGTRFTNSHETLIMAVKDQNSGYTFHYKSMKIFNDDLQMRSDWNIPICAGSERIKINGTKAHSTQKPEELLKRIIISTSNPGDVVLDPFMGSGTTGSVSKLLGRNFIGIEGEKDYVSLAEKRIAQIKPLEMNLLSYPAEERPPKVSFGELVSSGYIREGETVYSENRKFMATVLSNATLVSDGLIGSIHSVSASLMGKPRFNGWHFWFVERDGEMVCIDNFRKKYIIDLK